MESQQSHAVLEQLQPGSTPVTDPWSFGIENEVAVEKAIRADSRSTNLNMVEKE